MLLALVAWHIVTVQPLCTTNIFFFYFLCRTTLLITENLAFLDCVYKLLDPMDGDRNDEDEDA